MFQVILIFAISLTLPLLSIWILRKAEARSRAALRAAMEASAFRPLRRTQRPPEGQYLEVSGYLIGDSTCQFNARSAYIRCAVNPSGPCKECPYYQPLY